jgi:hypothetical protein
MGISIGNIHWEYPLGISLSKNGHIQPVKNQLWNLESRTLDEPRVYGILPQGALKSSKMKEISGPPIHLGA